MGEGDQAGREVPAGCGGFRFARTFDGLNPAGLPYFSSDHPVVVDQAEWSRILAYLYSGVLLLAAWGFQLDCVDPGKGKIVPMGFRTDGVWIWNDEQAYYTQTYGMALEPDFANHLAACDYQCTPEEDIDLDTAEAALFAYSEANSQTTTQ